MWLSGGGAGEARALILGFGFSVDARVRISPDDQDVPGYYQSLELACFGNPDPVDMKVYCPEGEETFNDDETTEEAPT